MSTKEKVDPNKIARNAKSTENPEWVTKGLTQPKTLWFFKGLGFPLKPGQHQY